MKLHDATIMLWHSHGSDEDYYVAVPPYMAEALNSAPELDREAPVWIHLQDYQPLGDDKLEEASRFRGVVFPFEPPKHPTSMCRVRVRMVDRPGALFAVSWVLGQLGGLNLPSSTGIDAVDVRGLLDTVAYVDSSRITSQYGGMPRADGLQNYLDRLIADLKRGADTVDVLLKKDEEPLSANDEEEILDDLWRRMYTAGRAAGVRKGNRTQALGDALLVAVGELRDYLKRRRTSFRDLIYLIPEMREAPYPGRGSHVYVERCFAEGEVSDNLDARPAALVWNKFEPDFGEAGEIWLRLPRENDFVAPLREANMLPDSVRRHSCATIGVEPESGTLSVHFKATRERIAKIAFEIGGAMPLGALSKLSSALAGETLDLRTLADRSLRDGEATRERVEIAADISSGPLALLDNDAIGRRLELALEQKLDSQLTARVNWPCGVSPREARFAFLCACAKEGSEDWHCPREDLRQEERASCKAVCDELRGEDSLTVVSRWISPTDEAPCSVGLRVGDIVRVVVLQRTKAWLPRRNDGSWSHGHLAPLSVLSVKALAAQDEPGFGLDGFRDTLLRDIFRTWPKATRPTAEERSGQTFSCRPWPGEGETQDTLHMEFKRLIGAGGSGEVWTALSKEPHMGGISWWAVKIFKTDRELASEEVATYVASVPDGTAPLTRIAEITTQADEVFRAVLMQLLEPDGTGRSNGHSLDAEFLNRSACPSLKRTLETLRDVAVHVDRWAAPEVDLIHWDIKPANVFRMGDGTVRLLDLGLIGNLSEGGTCERNRGPSGPGRLDLGDQHKQKSQDRQEALARLVRIFGTCYHVASEIRHDQPTTARTPVYSWGSLACNLLGDPRALEVANPDVRPDIPQWVASVLGDSFVALLKSCLEEDEIKRPSPHDLVVDMAALLLRLRDV